MRPDISLSCLKRFADKRHVEIEHGNGLGQCLQALSSQDSGLAPVELFENVDSVKLFDAVVVHGQGNGLVLLKQIDVESSVTQCEAPREY